MRRKSGRPDPRRAPGSPGCASPTSPIAAPAIASGGSYTFAVPSPFSSAAFAFFVAAIIALAGFGIFNVLTMSVLSKIKEIAILRSMGYSRRDISAIFLWQGALVAVIGGALGLLDDAGRLAAD